ncbi:hypothetical protein MtrunA17_Chr8g0386061 [Medicago truncatula]|uniref:UBL3-like ubiquitin domain-containing protein n=1 Tax=Medicago truncatula TaxID=3880 RepID=A0A396GQ57_MEDTR|nr:hypothetical protein MtrunA17_Chr8g0386061 [Medicago truncatula]
MAEEDSVEIRFRLNNGSDIGPFKYSSAATVDMLKQRIISHWPQVEVFLYSFRSCLFDLMSWIYIFVEGKSLTM